MRESATKKVIAESLKRRMLRHNLTDITVTDLCTDSEINRRTFYRHFTDKYQLVTWIYENGFQKAIGDDEPGLFDLFGRVCTYLYADRAFYARALRSRGKTRSATFSAAGCIHICRRIFPTFFPIRRPRRSCPGRCRTSSSTSCKTGSSSRIAHRRRSSRRGR